MTDPERVEEPRPDRLPQIQMRREQIAQLGWIANSALRESVADDVAWLVAEVERLRGKLAMAESALEIRRKLENWRDNR